MSRFTRENVPVVVGPCECPGTPHGDGDVVYLAPKLSLPGGMAALQAWRSELDRAAGAGAPFDGARFADALGQVWLRHGVVGWTFQDDKGTPIPITEENLRLALPWDEGGREVADKADDLYAGVVFRPLAERPSSALPTGSTAEPTSTSSDSTPSLSEPSSPPASAASQPSTT